MFSLPLGVYGLIKGVDTLNWLALEGVITESKIIHRSAANGGGWRKMSRIKYKYTVNNKSYVSDRIYISPVDFFKNQVYAKSYAKKYKNNQTVKIYYNPESPSNSVIEKGINMRVYLTLAVGLFFILVAFWSNKRIK